MSLNNLRTHNHATSDPQQSAPETLKHIQAARDPKKVGVEYRTTRPPEVPVIQLKSALKSLVQQDSQPNQLSAEPSDYNITISEGSRGEPRGNLIQKGHGKYQSASFGAKNGALSMDLVDSGGSLAGTQLPVLKLANKSSFQSKHRIADHDFSGASRDPINIKDEADSQRSGQMKAVTFGPKYSPDNISSGANISSFRRGAQTRISKYLKNLAFSQIEAPQPKMQVTRLGDLYTPSEMQGSEDGILKRTKRPVLVTNFQDMPDVESPTGMKDGKNSVKDSASDIRLTETSIGTVDSGLLYSDMKSVPSIRSKTGLVGSVNKITSSKLAKTAYIILILVSMFGDDFRRMVFDASQDIPFDILMGIVMGVFVIEILFAIATRGWNYFRRGEIVVDLLATGSMLLDITIISESFLASFQK